MNPEVTQSAYVLTLSKQEGIGQRSLLRILSAFPNPDSLVSAPREVIQERLGDELSRLLDIQLLERWEAAFSRAREVINRHHERNVVPISVTSSYYPALLKLIPDPPALLFARGDLTALSSTDAIAIVGTRDPTEYGRSVAGHIARHFGSKGFVVVSGLAKGIDTAAHEGALAVGARTIAVLGTPLDQIYPVENKPLAERIANDSGVLIAELALGTKSFRNAFVQRDRIQSGLSLAVMPVQSDLNGGTMHTVRFAEKQKRLLLCPTPAPAERRLKQYAAIVELIRSGRAREFQKEDYASLVELLWEHRRKLLSGIPSAPHITVETPAESRPTSLQSATQEEQGHLFLDTPESPSEETIEGLLASVRQLGLDSNRRSFDEAVSEVRKRVFPRRGRSSGRRAKAKVKT